MLGATVFLNLPEPTHLNGSLAVFGLNLWLSLPLDTTSIASPLPPGTPEVERDGALAAGALIAPGGRVRLIPLPDSTRYRTGMSAVTRDGRGLDVFWGQAADSAHAKNNDTKRIWYAHYDGRRWTAPEVVLDGTDISWSRFLSTVGVANRELIVAAPARDGEWHGVLVARLTNRGWQRQRLDAGGHFAPNQVTFAMRSGRPTLFYVDYTDRNDTKTAAIMFRELDPERGWSGPKVAIILGSNGAFEYPQAVTMADGTAHLFWLFQPQGRSEIGHIYSRDGLTWQRDAWPLNEIGGTFSVTGENGGSILMAVENGGTEEPALTRWHDAHFDSLQTLPMLRGGGGAYLGRIGGDTLAMFWSSTFTFRYRGESALAPITLVSRGTAVCSARSTRQ